MKSFKEYANTTENTENKQTTASAEELAAQIASAYNGKSNLDMLQNILAQAEASKRAGTLSNEEIETFYQSFAPMLNGMQKRKLREIVERLKSI